MENLIHTGRTRVLSEKSIAKIASGFASRPNVTIQEIIDLIERLGAERYSGISQIGGAPNGLPQPISKMTAVMPLENAVTADKVFCLCCGRGFAMLKRHLGAEHGLSEAQYREAFSLSEEFPLVAPSYSERKAAHAKRVGLGKHSRE